MDNNSILLIGGGGHCKSVVCSLMAMGSYERIGIVEQKPRGKILGVPVVGTDDELVQLRESYTYAFVTVGSIGDTKLRRRLWELVIRHGFTIPNVIDPTVVISPYVLLNKGAFAGKRAVLNAGVVIGDGAIINTGAIVEHDCRIGEFAHIAPGAVLGGDVQVGKDSHIGSNAVVLQGIRIGSGCLIGAGSVVTRDMPDGVVAYGSPCREIRKNEY